MKNSGYVIMVVYNKTMNDFNIVRAVNKIKAIIFSENFSLCIVAFSFVMLIASVIIFVGFSGWQFSCIIDEEKIAQFGDFTGGFIGTLLAFAASLLYFIALKEQQKDVKTDQVSLERQISQLM